MKAAINWYCLFSKKIGIFRKRSSAADISLSKMGFANMFPFSFLTFGNPGFKGNKEKSCYFKLIQGYVSLGLKWNHEENIP